MGMIRRADLEQHTRDAYVMDMGDLEKRGATLVDAANQKATQIIRDAQQQREQMLGKASEEGRAEGYADGHKEGFERGREEGLEQARQEHLARLEQLESMWGDQLGRFDQQRDAMLESARVQVVELAAAIAQRVVRRVVQLDPAVVVNGLDSVLSAVTEPTRLVVSVHPEDAELTRRELPALIERFAACEHAQVVTDPKLPRGSCVARTPSGGVIDASLAVQLDRIVESLLPSGHQGDDALRMLDEENRDVATQLPEEDSDEQGNAA